MLAQELNADVVAVDFLQPFLDVLNVRAAERGLSERIESQCCSIDALPFDDGGFDVIWSEGAIYNIGFEEGARSWKRHLRPGGILERLDHSLCGCFVLPPECWFNNHSNEAQSIAAAQLTELELYGKYSSSYGYSMYLAGYML